MSNKYDDGIDPATSYYTALEIIRELEIEVDDKKSLSQLERARAYLTKPPKDGEVADLDTNPSKALEIASSVAVENGYDDLLEVTDDFVCIDGAILFMQVTHPKLPNPIYTIADRWDNDLIGISESRVEKKLAQRGIDYDRDKINCGVMFPENATLKQVIEQHLSEGDHV